MISHFPVANGSLGILSLLLQSWLCRRASASPLGGPLTRGLRRPRTQEGHIPNERFRVPFEYNRSSRSTPLRRGNPYTCPTPRRILPLLERLPCNYFLQTRRNTALRPISCSICCGTSVNQRQLTGFRPSPELLSVKTSGKRLAGHQNVRITPGRHHYVGRKNVIPNAGHLAGA